MARRDLYSQLFTGGIAQSSSAVPTPPAVQKDFQPPKQKAKKTGDSETKPPRGRARKQKASSARVAGAIGGAHIDESHPYFEIVTMLISDTQSGFFKFCGDIRLGFDIEVFLKLYGNSKNGREIEGLITSEDEQIKMFDADVQEQIADLIMDTWGRQGEVPVDTLPEGGDGDAHNIVWLFPIKSLEQQDFITRALGEFPVILNMPAIGDDDDFPSHFKVILLPDVRLLKGRLPTNFQRLVARGAGQAMGLKPMDGRKYPFEPDDTLMLSGDVADAAPIPRQLSSFDKEAAIRAGLQQDHACKAPPTASLDSTAASLNPFYKKEPEANLVETQSDLLSDSSSTTHTVCNQTACYSDGVRIEEPFDTRYSTVVSGGLEGLRHRRRLAVTEETTQRSLPPTRVSQEESHSPSFFSHSSKNAVKNYGGEFVKTFLISFFDTFADKYLTAYLYDRVRENGEARYSKFQIEAAIAVAKGAVKYFVRQPIYSEEILSMNLLVGLCLESIETTMGADETTKKCLQHLLDGVMAVFEDGGKLNPLGVFASATSGSVAGRKTAEYVIHNRMPNLRDDNVTVARNTK